MNNSWEPLSTVEIAELKAQHFSPPEASYMTGIAPDRMLGWHKLGLIPEPREVKGRGHRRKYNFLQLAFLVAMRKLSRWGMPLEKAKLFSEAVLVPRIAEAFDEVFAKTTFREAEQWAYIETLAFYNTGFQEGQGDYEYSVFLENKLVPVEGERYWIGDDPEPDLLTWMRQGPMEQGPLDDVLIIIPGNIALSLGSEIEEVLRLRGTEDGRQELRQMMADFREGKKPPTSFEQSVRESLASGLRPDKPVKGPKRRKSRKRKPPRKA